MRHCRKLVSLNQCIVKNFVVAVLFMPNAGHHTEGVAGMMWRRGSAKHYLDSAVLLSVSFRNKKLSLQQGLVRMYTVLCPASSEGWLAHIEQQ